MSLVEMTGQTALVTGGGTRVGAVISQALVDAGCDVVVHYGRNEQGALAVVSRAISLGRRSIAVQADLTDRSALDRLADAAVQFGGGGLDVLVNNAANFERVPVDELDDDSWDRALELNLNAPYRLSIRLARALQARRGTMIAIGCVSAERVFKNYVGYSVSKAGLTHLVRGLAVAWAPDIRVNAVAPGAVLLPEDCDEHQAERIRGSIPLARLGDPEDVGRAVLFLAQNDYITGQILAVDGGRSVR